MTLGAMSLTIVLAVIPTPMINGELSMAWPAIMKLNGISQNQTKLVQWLYVLGKLHHSVEYGCSTNNMPASHIFDVASINGIDHNARSKCYCTSNCDVTHVMIEVADAAKRLGVVCSLRNCARFNEKWIIFTQQKHYTQISYADVIYYAPNLRIFHFAGIPEEELSLCAFFAISSDAFHRHVSL